MDCGVVSNRVMVVRVIMVVFLVNRRLCVLWLFDN